MPDHIIIIISSRCKDFHLTDQPFRLLTALVYETAGQSSKHDARQPMTQNSANPRQCLADCIVTPIFLISWTSQTLREGGWLRCAAREMAAHAALLSCESSDGSGSDGDEFCNIGISLATSVILHLQRLVSDNCVFFRLRMAFVFLGHRAI